MKCGLDVTFWAGSRHASTESRPRHEILLLRGLWAGQSPEVAHVAVPGLTRLGGAGEAGGGREPVRGRGRGVVPGLQSGVAAGDGDRKGGILEQVKLIITQHRLRQRTPCRRREIKNRNSRLDKNTRPGGKKNLCGSRWSPWGWCTSCNRRSTSGKQTRAHIPRSCQDMAQACDVSRWVWREGLLV